VFALFGSAARARAALAAVAPAPAWYVTDLQPKPGHRPRRRDDH
jgi:hypothetical protein